MHRTPTAPGKLPRENSKRRHALFQQFARIGQALASPARLLMVNRLAHGEKTVDQLAQAVGQSLAAASAHLKVLRGAGLVAAEKRGRQVHCRLANENVVRLWLTLRSVGEELLPNAREVLRQFVEQPETLASLTPEELATEIAHGRVTLIDLRPRDEFQAAHIPGALNLPVTELAQPGTPRPRLPRNKPVYAYCRGPYCIMAAEGTRRLRALGIPAAQLRFSVPEWNLARRGREAGG